MGDGFMASFGSAQGALRCAIALQQAFRAREGEPLHVRVGDPVRIWELRSGAVESP